MRHLKHRSYKYRTGPLNIIMPRASTFQSWTTLVNGVYIVDDCFTCSFSAIEVRKLVQCWVGFIFTISILLAYTTFGRGLPNELKNLGASLWLEFVKQYEHHTVQRKKPISSACLGFPFLNAFWNPSMFFQVEGKQKGNKASGFRVFGSCQLEAFRTGNAERISTPTPGWLEVERGTQLGEGSVHCWHRVCVRLCHSKSKGTDLLMFCDLDPGPSPGVWDRIFAGVTQWTCFGAMLCVTLPVK